MLICMYIYMGTRELIDREADEVSTSELVIEDTVCVPVLFLQEGMEACSEGKERGRKGEGERKGGRYGGREGGRDE